MNEPKDAVPPGGETTPGWWMDGESPPDEPRPAAEPTQELPADLARAGNDRLRAADLQLVHALLLQLNEREPAGKEARIGRVLAAVRLPEPASAGAAQPAPRVRPSRRRLAALVRWAVAISLMAAAATWLVVTSSNSAQAALDEVVEAIDAPGDRTYEIAAEPIRRPPPRPPGRRPPRPEDVPPPRDRRPGLDGATLYVRGSGQFVLYRQAPGGKWVINGSDGREHWLVRPEKPVLVSRDRGDFRIPMPEDSAAIALADIRSSLIELRRGYQIEELPAERLTDDDPTLWQILQAKKVDQAAKGSRTVVIWYHPATNLIGQIRFDQIHLQGRPEPWRVTITLVSQKALPSDWFGHEAHHPAGAPVELLSQ